MNHSDELMREIIDKMIHVSSLEFNNEDSEMPDSDNDEIIFSKEHEAKIRKLLRKEKNKKFLNLSKFVSAFLILSMALGAVTVPKAQAWVKRFINFNFIKDAPNTDYDFDDLGGFHYSDDNFAINYIPLGFTIEESVSTSRSCSIRFSSSDKYFHISKNNLSVNSSIDTEGGTPEKADVNGYDAIYTDAKNINSLIWATENYAYCIYGTIERDEIFKIAQNITELN